MVAVKEVYVDDGVCKIHACGNEHDVTTMFAVELCGSFCLKMGFAHPPTPRALFETNHVCRKIKFLRVPSGVQKHEAMALNNLCRTLTKREPNK